MNDGTETDGLTNESFVFHRIATIRSCFPDRFGIPRQSGLVPSAIAHIEFPNTEANRLSLRGIEAFSHLWVLFVFHQHHYQSWKPLVNPPRLGSKKSVGLYATRSPNRFNPIGMSAVELSRVEMTPDLISLEIRGGDFLDQTPVLDLKPYVTYADSIPAADSAWAIPPAEKLPVQWSDAAKTAFAELTDLTHELQQLIEATIALDPRPGYERGKDAKHGAHWYMAIADWDIAWTVAQGIAIITQVKRRPDKPAERPKKKEG
jgi:tRNA (adenine37-N6)-methyltransferase